MTAKQKIYVAAETWHSPPVKIGIAANPSRRVNHLQIGNPKKMFLAWDYELVDADPALLEKQIHDELAEWHVRAEWFDLCVETACRKIEAILRRDSIKYWDLHRKTLLAMGRLSA